MTLPLLLVLVAGGLSPEDPDTEAFIAWAREQAVALETVTPGSPRADLQPLKKIVGSTRLVLLGESRHDAGSQFLFKHRLIEFLVEEMGFTLFAMEESLPAGAALNQYILEGKGDPVELLHRMGAWFIWDTEEVLALVRWMRAYNKDAAHEKKIRFFGMDIMDPHPALKQVLDYLDRVDPEHGRALRQKEIGLEIFSPETWQETMARYQACDRETRIALGVNFQELLTRIEENRARYLKASSEEAYTWALRLTVLLSQVNRLFTTWVEGGDFKEAGYIRERAMADNLRWIMDKEAPGEKLIVWAHNFHVTRGPIDIAIPNRPVTANLLSMAVNLSEEYGERMMSFGFCHDQKAYGEAQPEPEGKPSFNKTLSRLGLPLFALDLRSPSAPHWLNEARPMRGEGGFATLVPRQVFDVIFYFDRIQRSHASAQARERLGH